MSETRCATECGAVPPNVGNPVPCHREPGHPGGHISTTGCAGSEVRWGHATPSPRLSLAFTGAADEPSTWLYSPHGFIGTQTAKGAFADLSIAERGALVEMCREVVRTLGAEEGDADR